MISKLSHRQLLLNAVFVLSIFVGSWPAIVVAKTAPIFTTCEALPGLSPVEVMLFSGTPDENMDRFVLPEESDDPNITPDSPPSTTWPLSSEGRPWNIVCGYVDSASPAAKDTRLLKADSIIKRVTVPVPDDAVSCAITFTPGPVKGFPNVKNAVCTLKPGAHAPQKPNRS